MRQVCISIFGAVMCLLAAGAVPQTVPALLPIRQELNVVYGKGGDDDLKLDLYMPQDPAALCPAIVLLHGGGWSAGSKDELRGAAAYFAQRGYVAVTADYRLAPKAHWPAQIQDAKCAVRWLRANSTKYHVDPQRIGAMGASAGAHLALLLGMSSAKELEGNGGDAGQSSSVVAVVSWMGPTDLTKGDWSLLAESIMTNFIGADRAAAPEAYKAASPITYVHKGGAPVLIVHGTKDTLVPFEQAKRLDAALRAAGVESQLEPLEGKGHGDGVTADDVVRLMQLSFDFLDQHLKAPR